MINKFRIEAMIHCEEDLGANTAILKYFSYDGLGPIYGALGVSVNTSQGRSCQLMLRRKFPLK